MKKWSASHGFSVKEKNNYALKKTGGFNHDFLCVRGGKYEKSRKAADSPERKVTSPLTRCNLKTRIRRESACRNYTIKLVNINNNYKPTADVRVFYLAYSSFDVDVQRFLRRHLEAGTKANNIVRVLTKCFPECKLVSKDIYNMIVQHKRDQLEGEDEMTALMRKIVADGAMHCIKVNDQII